MPSIRLPAAILLALAAHVPAAGAQAPAPRPADRTFYRLARDSAWARPVNRSTIAFVLPAKDLLAENVAYDPVTRAFFVGSTRHGSITRRAADGTVSDFVAPGTSNVWMVIGMKVDSARRLLWVNTTGAGNHVHGSSADDGRAALLGFDIATGAMRHRFEPAEPGPHFFNDLVVGRDGTVWVTDMRGAASYRLRPGAERLERWLALDGATDPNGIALSADGRTFYVAHDEGISAIDAASGERTLLPVADGVDVVGIDGLYWMEGALVGIQGGRRNRVQRFTLGEGGRSITAARVVEANHPMFMNPTTGVMVGPDLYYVANSQFGSFERDGTLFPEERLFETVILRVRP